MSLCIRNTPAYGKALAEGHGLTEVGPGELVREAMTVMSSITSVLSTAQRRIRGQQAGIDPDEIGQKLGGRKL